VATLCCSKNSPRACIEYLVLFIMRLLAYRKRFVKANVLRKTFSSYVFNTNISDQNAKERLF
jgi:hypothetical protein